RGCDRRHQSVRRPRKSLGHLDRYADRVRTAQWPYADWNRSPLAGFGYRDTGDQRCRVGSGFKEEAKMKAQQRPQLPPRGKVVLEARGIVKRYGHVTALAGADLELASGEVLAIVGDNGAGKSTLIKVLCGAVVPDEGKVLLDGAPVHFRNPLDARKLGIETVYQDLAVAPALDIATNLFLGRELRRRGPLGSCFRLLDRSRMRREAQREMDELKFHLPSIDSAVEKLSGGQRQGVAVARSAIFARRLVIMDEPTAALGVRESGQVLN